MAAATAQRDQTATIDDAEMSIPRGRIHGSVQLIVQVLALTHFVEILRGVILRGATLTTLWRPVVKLTVFLVLAVPAAALRFRKRLDEPLERGRSPQRAG